MFKPLEKADLNQISLTGVRSIILIGLLTMGPLSIDEIRKSFLEFNIIDENTSTDILRIDIKTIKTMGCKIERPSKKNNFKYVLLEHPFSLKISLDEVFVLKRIYNKVKQLNDIDILIGVHDLFSKLAYFVQDKEMREKILGISCLKSYDINFIKELYQDCMQNKLIELKYKKSYSKISDLMTIYAQEMVFRNNKLYIYGFDINTKLSMMLNFRRILSVISKKHSDDNFDVNKTVITFLYKDARLSELEKNEKIIEEKENGYIVKGIYHNDFIATQRILYLIDKCVVIEPLDFKNKIIQKLKEMRKIYE